MADVYKKIKKEVKASLAKIQDQIDNFPTIGDPSYSLYSSALIQLFTHTFIASRDDKKDKISAINKEFFTLDALVGY
jgi:hypothetical protein